MIAKLDDVATDAEFAVCANDAETAADEDNASEAVVAVPANGPINCPDVILDDTNGISLFLFIIQLQNILQVSRRIRPIFALLIQIQIR